eukprot:CAMPEP_0115439906 /NCGR_PEP_ID=MMETSP0271-20121206/36016_1 /TAXON_ID=71861 /ORGANISM="Scrippsiella trochoidea, Strain CCMP3099" /LENGTH=49 /DNA_ID= /DNA_START= /DNA_END= /DNA_ORIENTATION=
MQGSRGQCLALRPAFDKQGANPLPARRNHLDSPSKVKALAISIHAPWDE